jgi:hypothetical protein
MVPMRRLGSWMLLGGCPSKASRTENMLAGSGACAGTAGRAVCVAGHCLLSLSRRRRSVSRLRKDLPSLTCCRSTWCPCRILARHSLVSLRISLVLQMISTLFSPILPVFHILCHPDVSTLFFSHSLMMWSIVSLPFGFQMMTFVASHRSSLKFCGSVRGIPCSCSDML